LHDGNVWKGPQALDLHTLHGRYKSRSDSNRTILLRRRSCFYCFFDQVMPSRTVQGRSWDSVGVKESVGASECSWESESKTFHVLRTACILIFACALHFSVYPQMCSCQDFGRHKRTCCVTVNRCDCAGLLMSFNQQAAIIQPNRLKSPLSFYSTDTQHPS